MHRKPRIFIGTVEVAGYCRNLAQGLKQLGYDVVFMGGSVHPFRYGAESGNLPIRLANLARTYRMRSNYRHKQHPVQKLFWIAFEAIARGILLTWVIFRFKVLIFVFGSSLLGYGRDLWLLKLLGKKIICNVGFGSDARPPYIDGARLSEEGQYLPAPQMAEHARNMKQELKKIERYADYVIASPLTGHFLSKPFINTYLIGFPCTIPKYKRIEKKGCEQEPIHILHAPSCPQAKGTKQIRKAIQFMKNKGHNIDYIEIMNRPNTEVLLELQQCDFIIDQIFSDTPMSVFSSEAAYFSKPAVVGGYGWEEIRAILPPESIAPSQICHPDDIESAIEKLILDKEYRIGLGQQAKEFIERYWTHAQVAGRYLSIIQDNSPKEWLFDPKNIRYVNGAGIQNNLAGKLIFDLVSESGREALQLSDKPHLEELFLKFAGVDSVMSNGVNR